MENYLQYLFNKKRKRPPVLAEDGPIAAGEAPVGGAEQTVLLRDGQAHVEHLRRVLHESGLLFAYY